MILHRAWRDTSRCAKKYGDDWLEYKRRVPYLFVPVSLFPFFLLIGDDEKVNRDGRDSISFRTANTWERKEELEGKKKEKSVGRGGGVLQYNARQLYTTRNEEGGRSH